MTIDKDGQGFITPPNSTFKGDSAQVNKVFVNLCTVVRTSATNLYLLMNIFFSFSSATPSLCLLLAVLIYKYYLKPDTYHACRCFHVSLLSPCVLSELTLFHVPLFSRLGNIAIIWQDLHPDHLLGTSSALGLWFHTSSLTRVNVMLSELLFNCTSS